MRSFLKRVQKKDTKKGFTLIEMIVSVGIFTIVMTIAIGALLVVYDTYRKTRTLKNAMENVNIATESMIKKIRTGDLFNCATGYDLGRDGCLRLRFRGKDNYLYDYSFNAIKKTVETVSCIPSDPTNLSLYRQPCPFPTLLQPITSPDVEIRSLKFYLYGIENSLIQDSVTVTISGFANIPGKTKFDSNFRVQTTVSKRLLDAF